MKLFGNRRRAAHAAPRQKLPRGTRAAIIAVCVVLALTGGVFAAWKLLVKPVQRPSLSQPDPEPVSEPDEAEPSVIRVTPHETEQPEEEPELDVPTEQPKALQDGVYNILICGTDDDGTRTDTIIIAHLDANDHTVALLSIPRDTPVATGGGGLMKINSVYAGGGKDGMERLAARLKDLLGFPVDGYVLVDLEAFQKTVDLVGGVEFDVPMDMNYEDPSQNLYIHLQKGLQTLDGEQAMGLVRFRKGYATQDIQRTQTQQQFLKALAKQCLSVSSLTKLREFADIFSQYVTTNLTTGNMVWFGKELLRGRGRDDQWCVLLPPLRRKAAERRERSLQPLRYAHQRREPDRRHAGDGLFLPEADRPRPGDPRNAGSRRGPRRDPGPSRGRSRGGPRRPRTAGTAAPGRPLRGRRALGRHRS